LTRQQAEDIARTLVVASDSSLGIEISTPVVYPNGDCVVVVIEPVMDGYVVHDAGFGAMYLETEGVRLGRSMTGRLNAVVARYECTFERGRVSRQSDVAGIAIAIALVANASRSVADHAVDVRRQTDNDFKVVVSEKLRQFVGRRLRENQDFRGKSGRTYKVTNVVLDAGESRPIAFVIPLSSRTAVPTAFAELFDLHSAYPEILTDSVYRDDGDIRQEDMNLLQEVGRVFSYSRAAVEFEKFTERRDRHVQ